MSKALKSLMALCHVTEEEVNNNTVRVITTHNEYKAFISEIKKQNTRRIVTAEVRANSGRLSSVYSLQTLGRSSTIEFEDKYTLDEIKIKAGNKLLRAKNFTLNYVRLDLGDNLQSLKLAKTDLTVAYLSNEVLFFVKEKEYYKNIYNNELLTQDKFNKLVANGKLLEYTPMFVGGSSDKKGTVVYKLLDTNFKQADMFDLYDTVLCGAMSLEQERICALLNKDLDEAGLNKVRETILKNNVRWAAKNTSSVSHGVISGLAVYQGGFTNKIEEVQFNEEIQACLEALQCANLLGNTKVKINAELKLCDLITKITYTEAETVDGAAYMSNLRYAEAIYNEFGVLIDPDLLSGEFLQIRPATMKCGCVVLPHDVFVKLLEGANLLAANNGTTVESFGDPNKIMLLTDRNGLKLNIKDTMFGGCKLEVLAISKKSEGFASKQMLRVVGNFAKDLGCFDDFVNRTENEMRLQTVDKLESIIEPEVNDKPVTLDVVAQAKDNDYYNVLNVQLNPNIVKESKQFFNTAVPQVASASIGDLDRMRTSMDIINMRMTADLAFILTGGRISNIIPLDCCFVNNDILELIFFKYPLQGLEECIPFKNMTMEDIHAEIKAKVEKANCKELHYYVAKAFSCLQDKIIVLPASKFIAALSAGSDFDYDGASCIVKINDEDNYTNYCFNIVKSAHKNNGVVIGKYRG